MLPAPSLRPRLRCAVALPFAGRNGSLSSTLASRRSSLPASSARSSPGSPPSQGRVQSFIRMVVSALCGTPLKRALMVSVYTKSAASLATLLSTSGISSQKSSKIGFARCFVQVPSARCPSRITSRPSGDDADPGVEEDTGLLPISMAGDDGILPGAIRWTLIRHMRAPRSVTTRIDPTALTAIVETGTPWWYKGHLLLVSSLEPGTGADDVTGSVAVGILTPGVMYGIVGSGRIPSPP